MARLLRRNIHLTGVDTSGTTAGDLGRAHPHGAEAGLVIPQVIEWPWAVDDAGCSFPAGIYGVRSVCDTRTQERNWLTVGHADYNKDRWIAVPSTLPGGYTARNARDHNKGPHIPAVFGFGGGTRGTPYFDLRHNEAGAGNTASANYQSGSGATGAYRMLADYTINGLALTASGDHMPSYRPSGGGGIVPLSWFPTALSDRTLKCKFYDTGHPTSLALSDYDAYVKNNALGGISLFTKPSPGFRRIWWRAVVQASDANWAALAETALRLQFRVAHNADNSTTFVGDTTDHLSAVFTKSNFTKGAAVGFGTFHYYYKEYSITDADYTMPAPGDAYRRWYVGYQIGHVGGLVADNTDTVDPKIVALSPRVDIPFWFTATSGNLVAPGGLP